MFRIRKTRLLIAAARQRRRLRESEAAFILLAALAGLPFFRVSSAEQVGHVVAQALAVKGPAVVEVDMRAIGAVPPYAPYATMGKHAERARQ